MSGKRSREGGREGEEGRRARAGERAGGRAGKGTRKQGSDGQGSGWEGMLVDCRLQTTVGVDPDELRQRGENFVRDAVPYTRLCAPAPAPSTPSPPPAPVYL